MLKTDPYEYFQVALKHWIADYGRGAQKVLSLETKASKGYISSLLSESRKKPISFELQVKLAEACGYEYLEFLQLGKDLMEGTDGEKVPRKVCSPICKKETPTPIDPSVQLLQDALEETGVKINKKQKEAVIKILREELQKSEAETKEGIKKYLKAFSG